MYSRFPRRKVPGHLVKTIPVKDNWIQKRGSQSKHLSLLNSVMSRTTHDIPLLWSNPATTTGALNSSNIFTVLTEIANLSCTDFKFTLISPRFFLIVIRPLIHRCNARCCHGPCCSHDISHSRSLWEWVLAQGFSYWTKTRLRSFVAQPCRTCDWVL
jgi:hypothetical protein